MLIIQIIPILTTLTTMTTLTIVTSLSKIAYFTLLSPPFCPDLCEFRNYCFHVHRHLPTWVFGHFCFSESAPSQNEGIIRKLDGAMLPASCGKSFRRNYFADCLISLSPGFRTKASSLTLPSRETSSVLVSAWDFSLWLCLILIHFYCASFWYIFRF